MTVLYSRRRHDDVFLAEPSHPKDELTPPESPPLKPHEGLSGAPT